MMASIADLEYAVWIIRQSAEVSKARVGAFLDGATLAAEQVQDKRLEYEEAPKPVSGWEKLGPVLTLVLESTIAGKVLSAAAKLAFKPVLNYHAAYLYLLPKNDWTSLIQKNITFARSIKGERLAQRIINREVGRIAQEGEGWDLFHKTLASLAVGGPAAEQNLAAGAKALRETLSKSSSPPPIIAVAESAGVQFVSAMQQYASLTQLGISTFALAAERDLRVNGCTGGDLEIIVNYYGWPEFVVDAPGGRIALQLDEVRRACLLICEAVIWARLYGFTTSGKRDHPYYNATGDSGRGTLDEVPIPILRYWQHRFARLIDDYNTENDMNWYQESFDRLSPTEQVENLQKYFFRVASALPKLSKDQLCPIITYK